MVKPKNIWKNYQFSIVKTNSISISISKWKHQFFFTVPESLKEEVVAPPSDYKSKCGNRNIKGIDITVDGKEDAKQLTQFGEWPNMCAISMMVITLIVSRNCFIDKTDFLYDHMKFWYDLFGFQNPRNGRQTYLGGASLITSGIVVTAAHKVL